MSNFILLHSIFDNKEILIDFDIINYCQEQHDGESRHTGLYIDTKSFTPWARVKESPEDILKMLNNGK